MKRRIIYEESIYCIFTSCDKSFLTSLDIVCSNETIKIVNNEEKLSSINFSNDDFNSQPVDNYSNIDFTGNGESQTNAKVYKINLNSTIKEDYTLSLYLKNPNKYVIDYLRVAILIDGGLKVYKYYDKNENIYHKENDPDSLLYFKSRSEIFNDLQVHFEENETKEVIMFVWIEEAELYDENGNRKTGWSDKSYNATPITMNLGVL